MSLSEQAWLGTFRERRQAELAEASFTSAVVRWRTNMEVEAMRDLIWASEPKKPKEVAVEFSDGTGWNFSALIPAHTRAAYYAQIDAGSDNSLYKKAYIKELSYSYEDDLELLDWLSNNMDWADVEHFALRLPPKPGEQLDYADEWTNADRQIVVED